MRASLAVLIVLGCLPSLSAGASRPGEKGACLAFARERLVELRDQYKASDSRGDSRKARALTRGIRILASECRTMAKECKVAISLVRTLERTFPAGSEALVLLDAVVGHVDEELRLQRAGLGGDILLVPSTTATGWIQNQEVLALVDLDLDLAAAADSRLDRLRALRSAANATAAARRNIYLGYPRARLAPRRDQVNTCSFTYGGQFWLSDSLSLAFSEGTGELHFEARKHRNSDPELDIVFAMDLSDYSGVGEYSVTLATALYNNPLTSEHYDKAKQGTVWVDAWEEQTGRVAGRFSIVISGFETTSFSESLTDGTFEGRIHGIE